MLWQGQLTWHVSSAKCTRAAIRKEKKNALKKNNSGSRSHTLLKGQQTTCLVGAPTTLGHFSAPPSAQNVTRGTTYKLVTLTSAPAILPTRLERKPQKWLPRRTNASAQAILKSAHRAPVAPQRGPAPCRPRIRVARAHLPCEPSDACHA